MRTTATILAVGALVASIGLAGVVTARAADQVLLNVSYDPTRELYEEFNTAFAAHWTATTGNTVTIEQSHGGSGKQAQAVIDGLGADVVSLALEGDINAIAEKIRPAQCRLARRAAQQFDALHLDHRVPRSRGQPQGDSRLGRSDQGRRRSHHAQSQDLRWRPLELSRGLGLVEPDQWRRRSKDHRLHQDALSPTSQCSTPAPAARPSPSRRRNWATCCWPGKTKPSSCSRNLAPTYFDIVYPSSSILAEPPVTVVDKNAEAHGTSDVAKAYLEYLYSPEGQTSGGQAPLSSVRSVPRHRSGVARCLPEIELISIDDPLFGGWKTVQPKHFGDGGIFDQIYAP